MSVSVRPPRAGYLLWLGAGFAVWGSALVLFYAIHAIGCAFAWSAGLLRLGLILLLFAHLAVIGWMWRHLARINPDLDFDQTGAFVHRAVVWATIAAFATTVFSLGPALVLTTCR